MSVENQSNNVIHGTAETPVSMDDFKNEIESSFKKVNEGDIVKGTVISVSDTEVVVDLQYYAEGIIKVDEISNNPSFLITDEVSVGDEIHALVIRTDDDEGNILLSKKEADNIMAWARLTQDLDNKTIHKVKISQAVNSGVITYLHGIRAFIPASQLSMAYVEDLEEWVGKRLK